MIKRIKVNLDVVEAMLYYWQATSEKEKVGESYIISIGEFPEMKYLYGEGFDKESVRKVLSAISNREMLNSESKRIENIGIIICGCWKIWNSQI